MVVLRVNQYPAGARSPGFPSRNCLALRAELRPLANSRIMTAPEAKTTDTAALAAIRGYNFQELTPTPRQHATQV